MYTQNGGKVDGAIPTRKLVEASIIRQLLEVRLQVRIHHLNSRRGVGCNIGALFFIPARATTNGNEESEKT